MNSNYESWNLECFKLVDGWGRRRPLFQVSTFSIITRRPWIVIRSRCRLHFSDQSSSPLEARWQSAKLHCPTIGAKQVLIFSDSLSDKFILCTGWLLWNPGGFSYSKDSINYWLYNENSVFYFWAVMGSGCIFWFHLWKINIKLFSLKKKHAITS